MKAPVFNQNLEKTETLADLNPQIFEMSKFKPSTIHEIAVSLSANARTAVAASKTRGDVRGGGKKPWQQKGTGRARAGSIRSPLWKGGGVVFGPKANRNFSKKINEKTRRLGLFAVLSDKIKNGELVVLDNLNLESGKTKDLSSIIKTWGRKIVLILPGKNESLARAARNLPNLKINYAFNLNFLNLISADKVVILKESLPVIEKTYLRSTN